MKVSLDVIKHYLKPLVTGRAVSGPDPMVDLANFNGDIREVRRKAEADDSMEWLRLSMDALIARPAGRIQAFVGHQYPLSDAEMTDILRYAYGQLWPGAALSEPGDEADIDFVPMTDEEWERIRAPDLDLI